MRTFIIFSIFSATYDLVPTQGLMATAPLVVKIFMGIILLVSVFVAVAQDLKELCAPK